MPNKCRARLVRWANTDSMGHYAFRVGPGDYELRLPGRWEETKPLSVGNEQEIVKDDHIPKLLYGTLRGLVVDKAGKPLAGAIVRGFGNQGEVIAGSDGRFAKERHLDTICLYARRPEANLAGSKIVSEDETQVTIELDAAPTATGRVVDTAGRAASGVRVSASSLALNPKFFCYIPVEGETDKEGMYYLPALPVGFKGEISVSQFNPAKDSYEASRGPKFVVAAGENKIPDTILKPSVPQANDPSSKPSAEKPAAKKKPTEALTSRAK